MSRVFSYCRVSTTDQTTENQVIEIAAGGFAVSPMRTIVETVSGSVPASERKGFSLLLNKVETGDVLAAFAAQKPDSQENRRPLVNDSSRVSGTEKLPNWTSVGNDRFGELDGNFWLTMIDRLRCPGVDHGQIPLFKPE